MDRNFNQTTLMSAINIIRWMEFAFGELQRSQQRQLVLLQGPMEWCDLQLEQLAHHQSMQIISDRHDYPDSVPVNQADRCLGSESALVVVDLFDGLNPDVVCIASGLVQSGGILLLLAPTIDDWDLNRDRYAQWQQDSVSPRPDFIEYFFSAIEQSPLTGVVITPDFSLADSPLPLLPSSKILQPTLISDGQTREQTQTLSDIEAWIHDRKRGAVLISADRGRGKSTCLGLLLQKLQLSGINQVLVTAASKQIADRILQHAATAEFLAPDKLLLTLPKAEIIVIDEAAMIPQSLLRQICRHYPLVIMATTTGGYEGTGQGFMLRFVNSLSQAELLHLELIKPVRWCDGDDLEAWINRTLMPGVVEPVSREMKKPCELEWLDPDDSGQSQLLQQVYALLCSAHYRTRPSDLRMIMENPDLRIVIARYDGELIAAALLNLEGGFEKELCREIFMGRRRPRGHLLAQMLTAQAGIENFAGFRGLRVLRIAVVDACRRQGVGSQLIAAAFDLAQQKELDYLGASFALDPSNLGFWQQTGFSPAHVSFASGKSTGDNSLAVLKPVSNGLTGIVQTLQQRIDQQLATWLTQFLKTIDVADVTALLRFSNYRSEMNALEFGEVKAFARGNKGFELCFTSLQKFVMSRIAEDDFEPQAILVEKAVLNRDWSQLSRESGSEGRRQLQQRLRALVDALIKA
jgi:tRNA(Met) cytidine acetyltransferase